MQRLGFNLPCISKKNGQKTLWMHASSVGEVQAALSLILEVKNLGVDCLFVVTTMTPHGCRVAEEKLPDDVFVFIAPLDIPFLVNRTLRVVSPDIYVCLETELWPVILHKLKKSATTVLLLNGRMSEKSAVTYGHVRPFVNKVLANFDRMAFITKADAERYLALGAPKERVEVAGNVKYDLKLPTDFDLVESKYKGILQLQDSHRVFLSGSTHTGEEELLLPIYRRYSYDTHFVWLIVPRHLERLDAVLSLLDDEIIGYDLYTDLKKGRKRKHQVVVVDVMGELSSLYSVGSFVFCGGSLVNKGGHNVMEAAVWDKLVMYGESMFDFRDAVAMLESAQAGCMVKDCNEIMEKIDYYTANEEEYVQSCRRAGTISQAQQGAARKQAGIIMEYLNYSN